MERSLVAASLVGAAGWKRRRLDGIRRNVGIGVSVADRVRQPAPLSVHGEIRRRHWTANQVTSPRVLPPPSRSEQLVSPLSVDLGNELLLGELSREWRETSFWIVESSTTGAICSHRIENRLRGAKGVLIRQRLGFYQ